MECGQPCRTTFVVIRRFARSSRTDDKQRGGDRWPEAATTCRRGGERSSTRQHGRRRRLEAGAAASVSQRAARTPRQLSLSRHRRRPRDGESACRPAGMGGRVAQLAQPPGGATCATPCTHDVVARGGLLSIEPVVAIAAPLGTNERPHCRRTRATTHLPSHQHKEDRFRF
ncbi:hypothetical protein MTO96_016148 [Rhipicephalus appendiculatus]